MPVTWYSMMIINGQFDLILIVVTKKVHMRLSHLTLLHKGQASTRYYRWMTRSWSPAPSSSSPSSSLSSSQQWAPALHHHSLCHLNLLQVRRVGLGSVLCHYCSQQVESAPINFPIIILQHFQSIFLTSLFNIQGVFKSVEDGKIPTKKVKV